MAAPEIVHDLIERFARNLDAYRSGQYNEAQVRREFIDPFFEALGWDVNNQQGHAEAYKEVIHEDAIKIGGFTKAPDYCFRIGGTRKFFVEAKKPSVRVKEDFAPAYQVRRYAWSAKLPLAIVTDFEEFAIYDCRKKPEATDKASTARTLYLTFDEYADRWDEIASIFSKDAVLKGHFDKYAASTKAKRGTAEVDDAFLKEIESWRDALARNIALRNQSLSNYELNYAVQVTIDRIIFLRICEDRGIENYGQLMALTNGHNVYARLAEIFVRADQKYNSGLFHFSKEKGREEGHDQLTPHLNIDDKVLKDILGRLYYPDSPYEFSVLPADILGQVYEQFLGKVIRLTAGHRAIVEDKPEVKKAGGVYYTPTYIVDYIVENTVGKLIEGKTPRQVSKIKVLDPACGSGSFLIGAYRFLLDWHRDWYLTDGAAKHTKEIYQGVGEIWHLTTAEKKRILLNNIYGVDIDPQAVEVTKLSLLLKVLEGESSETLAKQLSLFSERALPDLGENIKCGNSLIGPDFYDNVQLSLMDEEEHRRINVFDWKSGFPEVFSGSNPGFDAVIGNPPYIRVHNLAYTDIDYFKSHYISAHKRIDISVCFLELASSLLNSIGRSGFITSIQFFKAEYGEKIRSLIAPSLEAVIDLSTSRVFQGATTYPGIIVLSPRRADCVDVYTNVSVGSPHAFQMLLDSTEPMTVDRNNLAQGIWSFSASPVQDVLDKIEESSIRLSNVGDSHTGLFTGLNSALLLTRDEVTDFGLEPGILKRCIMGKDSHRYGRPDRSRWVIYPYVRHEKKTLILDEQSLKSKYPICYTYLLSHKDDLEKRMDSRRKLTDSRPWYSLTRFSTLDVIESTKIITPGEVRRNKFCIDDQQSAFYCARVFAITTHAIDLRILLAILNSKLLNVWMHANSPPKQGGYCSYNANILKTIPVPSSAITDPSTGRQSEIIGLVDLMKDLSDQNETAKTSNDMRLVERRTDAAERQIDQLVYELFALTSTEVSAVEDAFSNNILR